ncbi:hypothetical protein JAAARDRAFT_144449 [Jaapia argillacea MUCL 33604]|uniref:C3H1-type domain-containing protein n=1 Tax=Jaapia argillacea MUCL 33604 TaxID=933084 RepID=A0A067QD06_9AGAM|nr:hypothetical protein JAAARDRAFT_144449 [Jaapia argillacea MUCL 33604]
MVVCQYFLRGTCRFGDNCKNEHPQGQRQGGFGSQSWTAGNANTNTPQKQVPFSVESMAKDLTPLQDKPQWPLSSYGPAKHEPNLIPNLDESFEELRVKALLATKSGAFDDYIRYEANQTATSDRTIADALANVGNAYAQAVKASGGSESESAPTASSAFGATPGSAFGALGGVQSAFGGPLTSNLASTLATVVPNAPSSAFGKSSFGQSAFSGLTGSSAPSAFGQPSQPTSAFGQQTQSTSVFGQPSQPTSVFGQPSQPTSVFAQPSQTQTPLIKPATSGAFGGIGPGTSGATPGTGGGFSAFAGQKPTAFGLGATGSAAPPSGSVFGQSSFGQPPAPALSGPAPTSVFAAPAQASTTSVFGAPTPAPAATSVFGVPSQPTQPTSVFGVPSQPQQPPAPSPFGGSVSVFGQPSAPGTAQGQVSSVFGAPKLPAGFGQPSSQASTSPFGTAAPQTKLDDAPPDFLNAKSSYKPGTNKYDALLPDNYLQLLPKVARDAFEGTKFEWGSIPEWIPPKELR